MFVGVCSVFMKIENAGNGDDALLGARADIPGTFAELHAVRDGKMVKSGRISVPAKGAVELRPGGRHIMIFKMPPDMREGQEFVLLLTFEKSGEKRVTLKLLRTAVPSAIK